MKDRWINAGFDDKALKPFVEPELDIRDQKRIGNIFSALSEVSDLNIWKQEHHVDRHQKPEQLTRKSVSNQQLRADRVSLYIVHVNEALTYLCVE